MTGRCAATNADGGPCGAAPPRGARLCLWHDPERAAEAAAARQAGGQRRTRDAVTLAAFELDGPATLAGLKRVLDIVLVDALNLRGSDALRLRLLLAIVSTGIRLFEVSELVARVEAIEALQRSPRGAPSQLLLPAVEDR